MITMELLTLSVLLLLLGHANADFSNLHGYMVVGGKGKKDVAYQTHIYEHYGQTAGDCESFADAPFVTQHAIGLRNSCKRPMVCGGSQNPDQKLCHVYDIGNNTWSPGPSMKRRRVGASAVCLEDGVCWVFGGKSKSYTELYNPMTGQFEMGPEMPVNSAHGLCSALAPSGLIYIATRRQPGITRAFTFDPATRAFTELPSLSMEKCYMACGTLTNYGGDRFFVVGGGVSEAQPTSSVHVCQSGAWSEWPDYYLPIYGAAVMVDYVQNQFFFAVFVGVTTFGEETDNMGIYHLETSSQLTTSQPLTANGGPRSYAVVIAVEDICPGAPGL